MTPDFALSLSFGGIALLTRAALSGGPERGWYSLGEVALDVDDLSGALAVLREEALESPDGTGPEVKLILPNEQIKYLSVPRDDRDVVEQAEAMLQGATPYGIDELVYDWHEADGVLHVAAVARETLAEAEAFACDHKFVPLSFVAVAEDAVFAREPYFGATQTARTALPPGVSVRADEHQVEVIPGAPPPRGPIAVEHADGARDTPLQDPDDAAPTEETEPRSDAAATPEDPAPDSPAETADSGTLAPVDLQEAVRDTEPVQGQKNDVDDNPVVTAPGLASSRDVPDALKPLSAEPPAAAEPPMAFASLRAERVRTPQAPDAGSSAPDPLAEGNAPRITAPAASEGSADTASPTGPAPVPQPAGRIPPAPTFAEAIKARAQESLANQAPDDVRAPSGPAAAPRDTLPDESRTVSSVLARAQSGLGRGIGFISRRKGETAEAPPPADAAPMKPASGGAAGALTASNKMDEAERMTMFGARRNTRDQIGGKPRFLGLILTSVLLLILLGVAAWASVFVDDGLARFFTDEEEVPVETALSVPTVPEPLPDTNDADQAEAETSAPTPLALPDVTASEAAPEALDATAPSADPLLPEIPQMAALSSGLPASSTPPLPDPTGLARPLGADALSPEEAEARYAATGIWQRSPLPPAELRQGVLEGLVIASLDPSFTPADEPSALSGPRSFSTDMALAAPRLPPRAEQRYNFDARGLIRPAPEGVVTPDGYTLVLGRPGILPPARPGLSDPTVPEGNLDNAALPPALEAPLSAVPSEAPQDEPAVAAVPPVVPEEDTPPPGAVDAPPVADPALAGFRPLARPATLTPETQSEAQTSEEDGTELAEEATTEAETLSPGSVGLAAFTGPRPLARPAAIEAQAAQETPEPAAADAAVPSETAETEAAAPLPLPASRLAVIDSAAPQLRPRNIQAIVRRTDRATAQAAPEADDAPAATQVASVAPRTVSPPAPSRQSVSRAATQTNAINLRRVNLIGVYGKPSDRRALVRLANGRFQKVKVGDRLDGGRILAISDDQLRYQKGGRNVTLDLPQG